jgi:hypothetical protein
MASDSKSTGPTKASATKATIPHDQQNTDRGPVDQVTPTEESPSIAAQSVAQPERADLAAKDLLLNDPDVMNNPVTETGVDPEHPERHPIPEKTAGQSRDPFNDPTDAPEARAHALAKHLDATVRTTGQDHFDAALGVAQGWAEGREEEAKDAERKAAAEQRAASKSSGSAPEGRSSSSGQSKT